MDAIQAGPSRSLVGSRAALAGAGPSGPDAARPPAADQLRQLAALPHELQSLADDLGELLGELQRIRARVEATDLSC
jgi:hypothetical protein